VQKNSAERTKTAAAAKCCKGYPAVCVGTQGTVFVRSLTAFNKRNSANLQIFYQITYVTSLTAVICIRNIDYFAVKRSVLFFYARLCR
jgi:hypothetical protein